MGASLLDFYRHKLQPQSKVAFMATFFIGLLIHLYKFTNTLPNHDSLGNFYSDQNMVSSGRWFLSVACGFSSYFDLPWLIGIFSVALIALTAVVLVDLFDIENPVLILLIGGLIVASPAITETFFFEYTADGYMLAMLLAALTVYSSSLARRGVLSVVLPAFFICLSCGIYQAYVSFALLLALCYFVYALMENRYTNLTYWKYIGKQLCIYAAGMTLYYGVWQLCMAVQNKTPNEYQGIDAVSNLDGFSLSLSAQFKECVKIVKLFFFEWGHWASEVTLYAALNFVFGVVLLAVLLAAAWKSGLFHRKLQCLLAVCALFLCIPCACIWLFTSDAVWYRPMMLQSLVLLYIFAAILADRWCKPRYSNLVGLLLAAVLWNNTVIANISYNYMDKMYEQSYATGLEMTMRLHELESVSAFDTIAILGSRAEETSLAGKEPRIYMLSQYLRTDLLYDRWHVAAFLKHIFHIGYAFASDQECAVWETRPEVAAMEPWPSTRSMQVIDQTLVIKMGD